MADLPIIPLVAASLLLVLVVYKVMIYPALLSPLARIPSAHWSAAISPAWILFHRQQQNDTHVVHSAHARLGPIIRLAPNEASVNSVDGGIRTIYAGGFEKGNWYSNYFSNYGVEPMFAMEGHTDHSKRKRMLSNIYAKSTLQRSTTLVEQTKILIEQRLRPRLAAAARSGEVVELYDVFAATTMDFVAAYIFGMKNGSNFIQDVPAGIKLFHEFKARQKYAFWPQELPGLTAFLKRIGLKWAVVPKWVDAANVEIEAWIMSMCEKAESTVQHIEGGAGVEVEDQPTVYAQLRDTLLKDAQKPDKSEVDSSTEEWLKSLKLDIASELLDHTLAGFDTSSITLTWLAWELSKLKNLFWQSKLQLEVATLEGSLDPKRIDSLPILHAVLMESLRLHAAIPGNQPRVTPSSPAVLGDTESGITITGLPANVRVQSQAYSLHRNAKVFPDPEAWKPERWLNPDGKSSREMSRWFWAFGSGGRMCVGRNLAMLDMKASIVGLWGKFSTAIVDDVGMVPNGGYMAEPLGVGPGGKKGIGKGRRFLRCTLEELEN